MRRHTRRKVIVSKVKTDRIRRRATVRIRRCGTIDGRTKTGIWHRRKAIIDRTTQKYIQNRATTGTISYRSREEIGVRRKDTVNLKARMD